MLCAVLLLVASGVVPAMMAQTQSPAGSQAQKWEGQLVDVGRSACGIESARAAPSGMCPVSVHTTAFGLLLRDGQVAKFDEGGNAKAIDALKRSKKGAKAVTEFWRTGKTAVQIRAQISGTLTSDTVNVESVRIE